LSRTKAPDRKRKEFQGIRAIPAVFPIILRKTEDFSISTALFAPFFFLPGDIGHAFSEGLVLFVGDKVFFSHLSQFLGGKGRLLLLVFINKISLLNVPGEKYK